MKMYSLNSYLAANRYDLPHQIGTGFVEPGLKMVDNFFIIIIVYLFRLQNFYYIVFEPE